MKSFRTFCCVFQYQTKGKGSQHGSRKYDDLQNWHDMTSHENPLLLSYSDYISDIEKKATNHIPAFLQLGFSQHLNINVSNLKML